MADIVQLEEKGTVLYPKTHVNAIDKLDATIHPKQVEWVNITYNSGFITGESMPVQVMKTIMPDKRIMVVFRGRCGCMPKNFNNYGISIGTIPVGYRPKQPTMIAVSGNGGHIGRCQFSPEGNMEVATDASGMSSVMFDGCFYFID